MARAMQSAGEGGAVQEPRMSNVTLAFLEACCREEVSTYAMFRLHPAPGERVRTVRWILLRVRGGGGMRAVLYRA